MSALCLSCGAVLGAAKVLVSGTCHTIFSSMCSLSSLNSNGSLCTTNFLLPPLRLLQLGVLLLFVVDMDEVWK